VGDRGNFSKPGPGVMIRIVTLLSPLPGRRTRPNQACVQEIPGRRDPGWLRDCLLLNPHRSTPPRAAYSLEGDACGVASVKSPPAHGSRPRGERVGAPLLLVQSSMRTDVYYTPEHTSQRRRTVGQEFASTIWLGFYMYRA
jgi:hypothetical protein